MPNDAQEDQGGSTLFNNDQGQLHVQIDRCATNLPALMAKTREQINDAIADGDVATAQRLGTCLTTMTDQYGSLISYQIAVADQSQEMHDAIVAMAGINKQITAIMAQTASETSFLSAVTPTVTGLNGIVGSVIKKKPATPAATKT